MPSHSRRKSWLAGLQHHAKSSSSSNNKDPKPAPPSKHHRTHTAPDPPTLLRLPSTASTAASVSTHSRRASNPSTPTASSETSASYFSPPPPVPQPPPPPIAAPAQDPRSPTTRRPPASHSGHGIDNSRGPPVTLLTRGNSDIAPRRSLQKAADFAFAQQQFAHAGLVSSASSTTRSTRRSKDEPSSRSSSRRASTTTASRPARHMPSSVDDSSDYGSGPRSQVGQILSASSTEGTEDVFINIAADNARKHRSSDKPARIDKLKSRVARVNNRQASPTRIQSPGPVQRSFTTPTTTRITPAPEPKSSGQRRPSLLPTKSLALPGRIASPSPGLLESPSQAPELVHKTSFSRKDAELSPRDFLAQFSRRPSQPDTLHTPPQRTTSYRPSNLNYSSSRGDPRTPYVDTVYETTSRHDGTESHASTGPAASVWDELDELKTRIRKIELGGKIPATSGAIVSQASTDRPRTANTSATTVSSSPNQQRKPNPAPSEATVDTQASSASRVNPLLQNALAGVRQHVSPAVYRILEATASEAVTLAEIAGSTAPQSTLHSTSSILSGSTISDRQIRRRADNICRSLTELCLAMSDSKAGFASPALRSSAAAVVRRPSVHINGESPTIRQSIEVESNTLSGISPSRALSRIEARRTSSLAGGANGRQRDSSQEPPEDRQTPSRLSRAGTSLHRTRASFQDEDEELPIRAPSRALTDYRTIRAVEQNRLSTGRQYTSREPLPETQPVPTLRPTSALRRPTLAGISNESSLLFRDGSRRYDIHRESSPAYERQAVGNLRARAQLGAARNPNNRNSIGGITELNRTVSLGRRMRGSSIGE